MNEEIGSHLASHFNNCMKLIQTLGEEHHKFNQHRLKNPPSGETHESNEAEAAAHTKALRKAALPKRAGGPKQTDVVPPQKRPRTMSSGPEPHDGSHSGPAV